MDTNCALKALMVTVAGGGFGFLMALFMNSVEMRDMDLATKFSTKMSLRVKKLIFIYINLH
jgi:import inner membrane translocase subunit TIM22